MSEAKQKTVEAVCIIGFRVGPNDAVAPGERIELPDRDFRVLERVGKVISAALFDAGKADAPKKRGRPKKDESAEVE